MDLKKKIFLKNDFVNMDKIIDGFEFVICGLDIWYGDIYLK